MEPAHGHVPVLVEEVERLLSPRTGDTVVDGTLGGAGHAARFAERIGSSGTLVGVDVDPQNAGDAREAVLTSGARPRILIEHASFAELPQILRSGGLCADVLFLDLGFSSNQMDDPARGLSFRNDGPLDMRFDPSRGQPASALIAQLSERELSDLIYQLGEDPFARRIARKLVEARGKASIQTTAMLARLVREAYGSRARTSRMHPATRTFMALRIAVNDELGALRRLLEAIREDLSSPEHAAERWTNPGARIGIISFHSLEDRMVKLAFRELVREGRAAAVTRKPVTPGADELRSNPRSRSGKLRVIAASAA